MTDLIKALEEQNTALLHLLRTYAAECFHDVDVAESRNALSNGGGVIAYITSIRFQARAALASHQASVDAVELPEPYRRLDHHLSHPIFRRVLFEPGDYYDATTVRHLIAEARADEREQCAKVCEQWGAWNNTAAECAAAIRALGDKQ